MSIYGNPITLGGGGLKSTDAILRVQAPAGSTVTISKGGVTKSDAGHENADDNSVYDYYFIIHQSQFDGQNYWTVTATKTGEDPVSATIIINAADEYNVVLDFRLPAIYQEVEYLENTGTSYIQTAVTPNNIASGSISFQITATGSYIAIWGADGGGASNSASYELSAGTSERGFWYCGTRTTFSSFSTNTTYTVSWQTASGTQSYDVNGTTYSGTNTGTPSDSLAVALFGVNRSGSIANSSKSKIYSFVAYDANNAPVLELIPCYRKSDSVAGMWDRVSKTFLTNAGSGTFSVGGDV